MMQNKKKSNIQGKDSFSRMNFLFQASMAVADYNPVLSSYYGKLCKNIGKKSVLRMHPDVKRSLCKKCSLAQSPGITSEIVAVPKRSKSEATNIDEGTDIYVKCCQCDHTRKYTVNLNYNFWLDNPESIVEINNLSHSTNKSRKDIELNNIEAEKTKNVILENSGNTT